MGLKEIYNAVFVRSDQETIKALMLMAEYIAYGYPTKGLVNDIIRKRGFLKGADNKRLPLTDNQLIEDALGEQGVICVEDIIHQLVSIEDNEAFDAIKEKLWPFQLAPKEELKEKKLVSASSKAKVPVTKVKFTAGGEIGHRGDKIDNLVRELI